MSKLALLGGEATVREQYADMFKWPIITPEIEQAVLQELRRGTMSNIDATEKFEAAFAAWQGVKYALAHPNGTSALIAAMFALGVGTGDEVILPSITYWASGLQLYSLGATPVFAETQMDTLCLDPKDLERVIGPRTKAIIVVHYLGHPADMDGIMKVAKKHKLRVIEDVSHAQGGLYKGKMLGTFGDVAGMSLMSGKSFAIGEGGMLTTDDREVYERALAWGHYERNNPDYITSPQLMPLVGLPLGGVKNRLNQLASVMGLEQLKVYDEQAAEIRRAMNRFWDLLEGTPGIRAHRVDERTGSTMAGWYAAHGLYVPEELGGLSVTRFCDAVTAEGVESVYPGANKPLHTHALMQTADLYHDGKPTRIRFAERDVRELDKHLPVSEAIPTRTYFTPWFKHDRPEIIERYAEAFRKVCTSYRDLLKDDPGNSPGLGAWYFAKAK